MPMMPPDMDLQKHFANRRSLSEARAAHLVSILNREQTSQNTDIRYGRRGTKIMRSYHDADNYGEPQRSIEASAMRVLWRDPPHERGWRSWLGLSGGNKTVLFNTEPAVLRAYVQTL